MHGFFGGAPGMGDNLAVKVRYRLGSRNCFRVAFSPIESKQNKTNYQKSKTTY